MSLGGLASGVDSSVDTASQMAAGESKWVEFRASACFNHSTGDRDKGLELAGAKTIDGFADARSGTLLLGVNDRGEGVGLKDDYRLVNQKRQDRDGYENWITEMDSEVLIKVATSHLAVTFADIDGNDVCRVDVRPAGSPIFMRHQETDSVLCIHLFNFARLLTTADALEYVPIGVEPPKWG